MNRERRNLDSQRAGLILLLFGGLIFGCCMYATVSLLFHHSAGLLVLRLVLAQFTVCTVHRMGLTKR